MAQIIEILSVVDIEPLTKLSNGFHFESCFFCHSNDAVVFLVEIFWQNGKSDVFIALFGHLFVDFGEK